MKALTDIIKSAFCWEKYQMNDTRKLQTKYYDSHWF